MTGVTLTNVVKRYGDVQVIHGVDLAIDDGEFAVFVGPSCEARTRIAHSFKEKGRIPRVPCPSASSSSPTQRASSSPSQCPISRTFSPCSSAVHSVLPRRPLFAAITPEAAARIWGVER